jgi:preprotein translocase subunit SecB
MVSKYQINITCNLINSMNEKSTKHASKDNQKRFEKYSKLFNQNTKLLGVITLDKGHINGKEIHIIFNNRVTIIFNYRTKKFVTALYLRNGQIKKYNLNPINFDKFIYGYNQL